MKKKKKWEKPKVKQIVREGIICGAVRPCAKTVDILSCLTVGGQVWPPNS